MKLIDSICAPGSGLPDWRTDGASKSGHKSGDDRYVFDERAGWACVVDGATDVGRVRLFPRAESDASRYAELFAETMMMNPMKPGETPQAFFARFIGLLRTRVEKEARSSLADCPRDSLPTAAACWVRVAGGDLDAALLGDSLAILQRPDGSVEVLGDGAKPAAESERAKRVMAKTPEERLAWLRDVRAIHNTDKGYWVFGVEDVAAAHIIHHSVPAPRGSRVLVMTDGFYRLVSPYGVYTDETLIRAANDRGVGRLLDELRSHESNPADDAKIGRFKTSDDATALLLEV